MYISLDNYREIYLKGKSVDQVLDQIEKIRHEISKTKAKLESPANAGNRLAYPSESSVIDVYKGYLNTAMEYVLLLGGEPCDLTEEEKTSQIFDSTVDNISCLTLTVGSYLQNKYELSFSTDKAELCEIHLGSDEVKTEIDFARAREKIRALHIGEWKETYTPEQYGCTLNEPTKWQLRVDYSNGACSRFFDGFGIFPYNFHALAKLLKADII